MRRLKMCVSERLLTLHSLHQRKRLLTDCNSSGKATASVSRQPVFIQGSAGKPILKNLLLALHCPKTIRKERANIDLHSTQHNQCLRRQEAKLEESMSDEDDLPPHPRVLSIYL